MGPASDGVVDFKKAPETSQESAAQTESEKKAEKVAAPSLGDSAKKPHWAQVFATFQQVGQSTRALEYAQALKKMCAGLQDLFTKYKEGLEQEDKLLQTAYKEALESYRKHDAESGGKQLVITTHESDPSVLDDTYQQAIAMQVKAHQQVESEALELQKAIQGAHQQADRRQKTHETKQGRGPTAWLPRRAGVAPCKFFMKTGDC